MAESAENTTVTEWNLTDTDLQIARYNNIVYYSVMIPVAVAGNIFTLTAVIMVLKLKKNIPNLLIGVLACTDLFSILMCHLISMASLGRGSYIGSDAVCYFQSMMSYTYFKMGFLTKCCISLDRFIALAFPLRYRRLVTMKKVILVIVHNVIFSFGTSALTLILDKKYIYQLPTWYMCVNDFQHFSEYKLVIVIAEGAIFTLGVILFFISNITVIKVVLDLNRKTRVKIGQVKSVELLSSEKKDSSNSRSDVASNSKCNICLSLKSCFISTSSSLDINSNKVGPPTNNIGSTKSSHIGNGVTPTQQTDGDSTLRASDDSSSMSVNQSTHDQPSNVSPVSTRRKKQQKELQLAKLVTIIVSVFVLLWLPYMAVIYWEHHNRLSIHPFVEDIVIKLVFANCCINPILYGVFNANFRRAYVYYMRMLAFYFTCKMTKRPQDIRYQDAKYDVPTKDKTSTFGVGRRGTVAEHTDISDIHHSDFQQHSTHQGPDVVTGHDLSTLNRILDNTKSDKVDNTDIDRVVLTQAIQALYRVPENVTDLSLSDSLPTISI